MRLAGAGGQKRVRDPEAAEKYVPTGQYDKRDIDGWTVYVSPRLVEQPGIYATMMTLLSVYVLYGLFADADVQMETTAKELFVSKLYFIVQTLAEVGVIVGVNLPGSRVYLAK